MSVELVQGKFEEICDKLKVGQYGPIDLVFADPPDNLGLGYDGYNDDLPAVEYEALLGCWLANSCAITNGPVFFTFNERWTEVVESAMAFSMAMDERQVPVAKITRIHTDASSMADRERKLTELACDCGFTLKFH